MIDNQNYDSSDMSKSQVITVYRPDSHRVGVAKPATLSGNNQCAAGSSPTPSGAPCGSDLNS